MIGALLEKDGRFRQSIQTSISVFKSEDIINHAYEGLIRLMDIVPSDTAKTAKEEVLTREAKGLYRRRKDVSQI